MNPKGTPENLLPPIKPGEVRNPEGRNQYSYRRDYELAFDRLMGGKLTVAEARDLNIPEHIRHIIESSEEVKRSEVAARLSVHYLLSGDEKKWSDVFARVAPKVEKREHSLGESSGAEALVDRLAALSAKRRKKGNGAGSNGGGAE